MSEDARVYTQKLGQASWGSREPILQSCPVKRSRLGDVLAHPACVCGTDSSYPAAFFPAITRIRKLASSAPNGRETAIASLYLCRFVGADSIGTCAARVPGGRGFQRNSSGKALAPFVPVARSMEYACARLVKHGVWKATYQRATVALVNDRVHVGSAPDAFQTRIDRTQELLTSSALRPSTRRRPLQCPTRLRERSPAQRA